MICQYCGYDGECRKEYCGVLGEAWVCKTSCAFKLAKRWQEPPMPETQRVYALRDKTQTIADFMRWLGQKKGYVVCTAQTTGTPMGASETTYHPVPLDPSKLYAEFFGIDLVALEAERESLLAAMERAHNAPNPNICSQPDCSTEKLESSEHCTEHKGQQ
jgi:hypothetical protein